MAPEVIEHKPYGEKADVFSFGILLWELLTGRVPYEDMTPLQVRILLDALFPILTLRPVLIFVADVCMATVPLRLTPDSLVPNSVAKTWADSCPSLAGGGWRGAEGAAAGAAARHPAAAGQHHGAVLGARAAGAPQLRVAQGAAGGEGQPNSWQTDRGSDAADVLLMAKGMLR